MNRKFILALCLFSGAAFAACKYGGMVVAPVDVGWVADPVEVWKSIGDELSSRYGSGLSELEGSVKIPVKFGYTPSHVEYNMMKICGETLKEAADRVAENAKREDMVDAPSDGGGGSGSGYYGGGYYGGGGSGWPPGCYGDCDGTVTVGEMKTA